MANIYLSSVDGNDADSGATWALAKATLAAALTAAGAGGTVWMDHSHAEASGTAITLTSPGTAASPTNVICVDRTGNPEPPTARAITGLVSTTTGSLAISLAGGYAYVYGVTFHTCVAATSSSGASIASAVTARGWVLEKCVLRIGSTHATPVVTLGPSGADSYAYQRLIDCSFWFGATGQGISVFGDVEIIGEDVLSGGSVPTTLFKTIAGGGRSTRLLLQGVNLSDITGTLVAAPPSTCPSMDVLLVDCKLASGVTIAGSLVGMSYEVRAVNCDSADTNYRFYRQKYQATETQETTIVRTGGASDGTTTFSRKIVTTANVTPHFAYKSMPLEFWQETVGSAKTVTIPIITDNVTLTDAEAWIEVEYLGTSGFPLGLFANDRVSDPIFGTPANQTTNTDTWTTTGLTTPVKQQLSVSITPQEKGIVRVSVCVAKASTTVYYDPKVTVT